MPRPDTITFRVSAEQRARLEADASALDRPIGWLIRDRLFHEVQTGSGTTISAPTSSDNFTGQPWTPQPPITVDAAGRVVDERPRTSNHTLIDDHGNQIDEPTATQADPVVAGSPEIRSAGAKPDMRNSAQKQQAARDQLLSGATAPVKPRKKR